MGTAEVASSPMRIIGNKSTEAIPVHRVAVLQSFTEFLADVGTPVERGLRHVGLPSYALEDKENYIPSHHFYNFLVYMARSQGILDLGFRVGNKFGANTTGPHMTAVLEKAPTLYQGLRKASELINQTVTNCRFGILQPPNCGYSYFYHSPSCGADNPAIEQIGWFGIETLIGMTRAYTGSQWQPVEIGLMADQIPNHYIREHFPHTRMRRSQPFSYIALENTILTLPPLHDKAAIPTSSQLDYQPRPDDFVGSLEAILLSYLQEGNLSIELAAGLCNTSKRTLQRKLRKLGTRYKEVLSHAQFRASSRMLQNPAMTATDIAYRLGYGDEAHFARAFRRIAGVSPHVYRQQFSH
jgi:AraC-like DNA-binding protein